MSDAPAVLPSTPGGAAERVAEWQAPPHWRAIDFLSDLHLAPALPRTLDALCRHLAATDADAVCLLGDVFELWVGDDARHQPFEREALARLRDAAAHVELHLMVGNRDFLMGAELRAAIGARHLVDPVCLHAWGRRVVLSHGDSLCLSDGPYQAFRRQVRDAAWQQAFLALPLAERLAIAGRMRQASRQHQGRMGGAVEGLGDLDEGACRDLLDAAGADRLIHGHTHRPARHDLGAGQARWVLSDWDLDDHVPRGDVLRLARDGSLTRHAVTAAAEGA